VSDPWAIEADSLTYAYPGGPAALGAVSLRVATGETVGLIGPNGAGKTTLFLCLAGVLPIPAGRVRVVGLDPGRKVDRRQLPSRLGLIFQNSDDQIFSTTVLDDVAFGPLNLGLPRDQVRRVVAEALAGVGLSGYEERVPFHLSGGEKRRVALAGVLAMAPQVLLLDEPTMHLDPRGRRELIRLLSGLGATKLIATHDLEMVLELCSRVIVLDQGQVRAEGKPADLLADAALMEAHGLEVPYSLRGQPRVKTAASDAAARPAGPDGAAAN
jgi:cobalt/nickel transport system ATP-binding protein